MTRKKPIVMLVFCLGAAFLSLMFFSRSSFLYITNPWTDSNASLTMGKAFIHGRVLYAEIFDQRGPYLYLFYGLAALVSSTTFFGVFLVELTSFTLFLFFSYQIASLYVPRTAWVSVLLLTAIIPSSSAFVLGGSPEQILLPAFSYALLSLLRLIKSEDNANPTHASLLANGVLCGVVLWTKYNMLGFYLSYILSVTIVAIVRKQAKSLIKTYCLFIAGMSIATLPWVIYFGIHNAIGDWINGYFIWNIRNYAFLRRDFREILLFMIMNISKTFFLNLRYTLFLSVGLIWMLCRKPALPAIEKYSVWLMFALSTAGIFIGTVGHLYYGLPLSVFAVFGIIALLQIAEAHLKKNAHTAKLIQLGSVTIAVLLFIAGFFTSMNTPYLRSNREEYVLFRFRDIITKDESATLMNYGTLDLGLYTLCGITPQTKYFCTLNLKSTEMTDAIDGYLQSGTIEYVVSDMEGLAERFDRYELIDSGFSILNESRGTVYLYQLKASSPLN